MSRVCRDPRRRFDSPMLAQGRGRRTHVRPTAPAAGARSAAALDRPLIRKICETGEIDGQVYIAVEYAAGRLLKERLGDGPLGLEESYRPAGESAEVVEEAHSRRIVHRDLKPADILLMGGGHVKVMDFGLAKPVTEADQTRLFEGA